jgi:periplasmic protein CpxP/Spy
MKKILFLFVCATAFSLASYAQPGGFQRRTVEERVASVHQKIDSAFKLEAAKLTQVDAVFTAFYKAQDAKREELMAGGGPPDRETMMAEMGKITDARDEKLKAILTADQFKTWKEQIEPSMRPQRRMGGGGGGGNQ